MSWLLIPDELTLVLKLIVYGVGFAFIAGGVLLITVFSLIWKEKYLTLRAERRHADLQACIVYSGNDAWVREVIGDTIEWARLGGPRLRVNSHDHNPTPAELLFANTMMTTGQSKMLEAGKLVPQKPHFLDLLPLLDRAERVLVKGAPDAGKTTLLQHIAQRSRNITVIDPHFKPGVWPTGNIVGAGRDYVGIEAFLVELLGELNDRYKRRAAGDIDFEPITVIIDEFQSIRQECKNGGRILGILIRESRKVGFRLFIGSHSELVKPLGLEGQGDIRDGLLIVRLGIDQITKQRRVTLDAGNGEQECYIPPYGGEANHSLVPDLVLQSGGDDTDDRIATMILDGASNREIAQEIWDKPSLSGDNFYRVKALREQYGG